ncbi:MAG: hypothetical protein SGPRY_013338 [Prymnesium sp.]
MPLAWGARHLLDDSAEALCCLASWGQRLALGTSSGALLLFAPAPGGGSLPSLRERKRPHAHAIAQLEAAEACGSLLVLLSNGSLLSHSLATLEPRAQLQGGTGVTHLALAAGGGVVRLAAGKKRAVVVYAWREGEGGGGGAFEPTAEIPLSEELRSITWGANDQVISRIGVR